MNHRSSSFLDRASIIVTNQIRGVPFQWFSIVLASIFIFYGVRDGFFCGQVWLPFDNEREFVEQLNCNPEEFDGVVVKYASVGFLFNGVVRLSFATTEHVEDLARASVMMLLWDACLVYISWPAEVLYLQIWVLLVCSMLYESLVAYAAWTALKKRNARKMKFKD